MGKPRRLKYSAWIGTIAERAAKEELEKKGYKFADSLSDRYCRECATVEGGIRCYAKLIPSFVEKCPLGENWFDLVHYAKDITKGSERKYRPHGVFWDFYATKNGQDYIIEVKAGSGRLSKEQKKVLDYAKKIGYVVLIAKVQLDLLLTDLQIEKY